MIWLCSALALAAAGLAGYAAWLGYFGGMLFVPVRVMAPVLPADPPRVAAVLLSGDMGFKVGMGPKIAQRLAADGIPVLGVNSLVYFRKHRSPAEIEAFVSDTVRRGLAFGHAQKLVLIGQSFGADMVQVGITGLPPALRAKVALVALVVPGDTVQYQASPAELLDFDKPDAQAIPTGRQLTWVSTLCVYGREETNSLCPLLSAPNVHKVALPGPHSLNRNADALYGQLKMAIDHAAPARD